MVTSVLLGVQNLLTTLGRNKAQESLLLSASWASSHRYCGCKTLVCFPLWASAPLFAEDLQKSLPETKCCVCKWEILLSTFLIYYQWSLLCPKQNKPQRIKKALKKLHWTAKVFCSCWLSSSQPGHNPYLWPALITSSAAPQTLLSMLRHAGDLSEPTPCRALRRCLGRHWEQHGWLAPMPLCWTCRGDFAL